MKTRMFDYSKFNNMRYFFTLILSLTLVYATLGQNSKGLSSTRYSGIQGVIFNPAQISNSPYRADINILSPYAIAGSDYVGINFETLFDNDEISEDEVAFFPKADNNFLSNTDILGPSFFVNLNRKSSIGLTSRLRIMSSINNINGELFENLVDDFDDNEDFSARVDNLSFTTHAWIEYGLSYGYLLKETRSYDLSVGATAKVLQGAGAVYGNSNRLTADYDASNDLVTTTGSLNFGNTPGFEDGDFEFSNFSFGFGLDLGAAIFSKEGAQNYWRAGISINDIGAITYEDAVLNNYDLNGTVSDDSFNGDDFEESVDNNYQSTETIQDQKVILPTAAHLFVDYQVKGKFYVNVESAISLIGKNKATANRVYTYATINPRFEGRWLGVSSPLTVEQHIGFSWGLQLKLGPIWVGSSTAISNFISDSSRGVDAYVALKVPLFKSRNRS